MFTLMKLDADRKLLDGLTKLKDHLYGRVCELGDDLRAELRESMTVSPKMKLFYQLIRRCKRVSGQVKRLAPKVRMAQLRLDMLSDTKWRARVIEDLGGEKALQSWERRMAKLSAPKGELWADKKLYWGKIETQGKCPDHKRLSNANRKPKPKPKPFDYSGITSNPLTVIDPCKLDREGYFRLAAIPRGKMEQREERKAEPQPEWYKQKIIDLREARAEQLKRFGREGLKPIPLTPTELREGIIIPFRQLRLNRAAQPSAAVYKYNNDSWMNGPRDAVRPKARSPS